MRKKSWCGVTKRNASPHLCALLKGIEALERGMSLYKYITHFHRKYLYRTNLFE